MNKKKLIHDNTAGKKILGHYVNGNHRTVIYEDGTKVKETGHWADFDGEGTKKWVEDDQDHFTYDFPENMDCKISDFCDAKCVYCHEGSTVNGKHGDLRGMINVVHTLRAGTEIAIGGGNALAHPDLFLFLEELKKQGVIANITVNQKHLRPYRYMIEKMQAEGLVHGIGISLTDSSNREDMEFIDTLGPNVVMHVIAGIFTEKDVPAVANRKVLILGYKELRRGYALLVKERSVIEENKAWLKSYLPELAKKTECISFDCLGIEQLQPKDAFSVSDDKWDTLFQGADNDAHDADGNITCATMYVDCVRNEVARSSTAPLAERKPFTYKETIEELFKKSTEGY